MGFHSRLRVSRSSSTAPQRSQARSLFASRPFAPEPEAPEADLGNDANLQRQADRSPIKPINLLTIPLYAPDPTAASVNPAGAIQRQELPERDEENTPIQAKLTIGQPNDPYEQEADRVASEVVNQISDPPSSPIQREEMQEEETLQTKPLAGSIAPLVQREEKQEEDLQMMPVQRAAEAGGTDASPDLESSIAQARGGGQPLDPSIREPIGQAMGADFSGVKVHTDAQADQLNRSVQAKAFTTGQDVFFRQGEYNPGSRGGQELIAHELTHVVQQNGGAVRQSQFLNPQQAGELTSSKQELLQRDPIKDSVMDSNKDKVKDDVNEAMRKIKEFVVRGKETYGSALSINGRDALIYAPVMSFFKNMMELIEAWDDKWSIEATSGLLLDMGLTMRKFATEGARAEGIMNEVMKSSRKDKKIDTTSDWAKEIVPEGTKLQASVSATTGQLLLMLRMMEVNTPEEIEAIMNGVIEYWNNSLIKKVKGEYHTAAEVWAAYTYHLEKYINVKKE